MENPEKYDLKTKNYTHSLKISKNPFIMMIGVKSGGNIESYIKGYKTKY